MWNKQRGEIGDGGGGECQSKAGRCHGQSSSILIWYYIFLRVCDDDDDDDDDDDFDKEE